ncbi:BacA-like protein [Candidatus Brocadiaceae bacterium B188]|nr:polymer-forming cytoskeletal protein [Candidatus Brocadia sapporoensis]QQR65810.1 MAG: polymer-forming cytoskeletal protein [Candidatus Brocadia sp.]RZV59691.1 MAG: polymer-forming cytoskeletal protein [Candidatus Brocadia sp. BROELEC01]TWU50139.1 BacA-like protein [Candidatus Brocadiaceae bacterium B188]
MSLFRKNTDETKINDGAKGVSETKRELRKESKMAEEKAATLTQDVEIKGTIKFSNAMKIDGKFEGEMLTEEGELFIGKTGSVKANVKVKNAVIEGRMDGNVTATEKVELKEKAHLVGDLKARILVIEEGVVFVGNCNVNPDGFKTENTNFKEWKKETKKGPE